MMRLRAMASRASLAALLLLQTACAARTPRPSTPGGLLLLPADHWIGAALRQMELAGSPPEPALDRAAGTIPVSAAMAALRDAHERALADESDPAALALAAAYLQRLEDEFTPLTGAGAAPRTLLLRAAPRLESAAGRLRAGSETPGVADLWQGPKPLRDRDAAVAALSVHVLPGDAIALSTTVSADAAGGRLEEGYVSVKWRQLSAWGGRRSPAFGAGAGGGIIAGGRVAVDGFGLYSTPGVALPGPFRALGAVHLEIDAGRLDANAEVSSPWLVLAYASLRPHDRLVLGATRGAMFADVAGADIGARELLRMLIGRHHEQSDAAENQIASLHARYRPPVPKLPVSVHAELGFEDSAGAWRDVPAILAGIDIVPLSGVPQLLVGLERASFARSCCGNPPWYRHLILAEGWSDRGDLLGHPLGGHGVEWLLHADVAAAAARLRVAATAFHRQRGAENTFAPDREGGSAGASLSVRVSRGAGRDAFLLGELDRGRGWTQHSLVLGVQLLF